MIKYACIKNNVVENVILFEESNLELIQQVKETFSYNELIEVPADLIVEVGYLYNGTDFYNEKEDTFIAPQPFPSWTRSGYFWEAPTPMPTDNKFYTWDEDSLSWIEQL